jgi:hypothetical protein
VPVVVATIVGGERTYKKCRRVGARDGEESVAGGRQM